MSFIVYLFSKKKNLDLLSIYPPYSEMKRLPNFKKYHFSFLVLFLLSLSYPRA